MLADPKHYAVTRGPWRELARSSGGRRVGSAKIGGEPPAEILVFPHPEWELTDTTFVTDDLSQKFVMEEFARRQLDILFDFEHESELELTNPTGKIVLASGWVTDLYARGEKGLWAAVSWTERAAQFIRAGEYRYFSPVWLYELASKRVIALISIALTNSPRSNHQKPLTEQAFAKALASYYRAQAKEATVRIFVQYLINLLNMPWNSTSADLIAEVKGILGALESPAVGTASAGEPEFKEATTVAEACGFAPLTMIEAARTRARELMALLELPEDAPLAQARASLGMLQTPGDMVARTEYEALQAELAKAHEEKSQARQQTLDQQIDALIAANRAKVPPYREPWFRAVAAKNLQEAKDLLPHLKEELPRTIAKNTDPDAQAEISAASMTRVVDGKEYEVSESSAAIVREVEAIALKENVSFEKASDIRLSRLRSSSFAR